MTVAPKVSVVVLTYNHERLIEDALRAVLTQDVPFDIEVIVGDDDSSDATRALAEQVAQRDDRVRVLPAEPNLGATRNLERLLGAARGRYIAVLEGDDLWTDAGKLAAQARFLDERPSHAGVYHAVRWVDSDGETIRVGPDHRRSVTHADLLLLGSTVPLSAFMFRNALPDPLPPMLFVSRMMGDWQLSLIVASAGPIGCIDVPMGEYRVASNAGAFSALAVVDRLDETIRVISAMADEAEAGDRALLRSHVSLHLFELAAAHAAAGDIAQAARVGLASARVPSHPRHLPWRRKRVQLGHVAIAAVSSDQPEARARGLRLLLARHRVLRGTPATSETARSNGDA